MTNEYKKTALQVPGYLFIAALLWSCGDGGSSGGTQLRISGSIIAAANTIADQDTQDNNAPQIDNSTPGHAQNMPNPGSVGGHVNKPAQDINDYYQIFLNVGDRISLQVADANVLATSTTNNDLKLSLFKFSVVSGRYEFLASSNDPIRPQLERLTVAQKGDYLIQVEAVSGSSNYILSVGQGSTVATNTAEIFPGEVIVKFRDSFSAVQLKQTLPARVRVLSSEQVGKNGAVHMRFVPQDSVTAVQTDAGMTAVATLALIRELNKRPDVLYAEPNYRYRPLIVDPPNDTLFPSQWNLTNIKLSQGWQQAAVGSPVTVAVLDTGIRFNHPDLANQFVLDTNYSTGRVGYDFLSAATSFDGTGPDDDPTDPGNPALAGSVFHGTLVAGVMASETNNSIGIAGIANTTDIRIIPLRILSDTGGSSIEICQAILFASGLGRAGGKTLARPVDVINMSLGTTAFSQTVQDCVTQARNAGVVIVAAAGNEASTTPIYPASYDGVISVSATTLDKKLASYSNTGGNIDIAAPGGDISQDIDNDGNPDGILTTSASDDAQGNVFFNYRYATGTSLSSPHVAGVVALMKWIYPQLTPAQLDQWLVAGLLTEDLTPSVSGADPQFGYGLIDARAALTQAKTAAGGAVINIPPLLVSTPRSLNFGATIDSMNLNLSNSGAGTLTVNTPSINYNQGSGWISLLANTDANGLGFYTVTVNRQAVLSPGNYTATLTINTTSNTLTIPVSMNVTAVDINANTGFTYILLTEASSNKVIRSLTAQANNGIYDFDFINISPGDYQIYVGTDMDKDGSICDSGESCGAYATLDRVLNISVTDKSVTGIKISTRFLINQGSLVFSKVAQ